MNDQRYAFRVRAAFVLATSGLLAVGSAQAQYTGISCEEFVGEGWVENGFAGLTAYRIFANFDPVGDNGVLATYGADGAPAMTVNSSDGSFNNDAGFDSNTAPFDLRALGIWSNQWDTYVTINATASQGNATSLSPSFATETNNLASNWSTEDAVWFVTPADNQSMAVDGRVLLAQFVVAEGETISGSLNVLDRIGTLIDGEVIPACTDPTGACCLSPEMCQLLTQQACAAIPGAVFLGLGVPCSQTVLVVNHEGPQSGWSHEIITVARCAEEGDGPACVEGPYHVDTWATGEAFAAGGINCEDFSAEGTCPIPADFFGPGSDPFDGVVCFGGVPLGFQTLPGFPDPLDFGDADTIVRRDSDPFDRCALPPEGPVTVDIVMERLHLRSIDPLVVTFNGGQDPEEWDVEVIVESSVDQPGGSLTALKTHCNGGTFDSEISVCPSFVFTNVKTGAQEELAFCDECNPNGIGMTVDGVSWIADVGENISVDNPVCSNFIPGIAETDPTTDCDCNENLVRDRCDIEVDPALDACNVNGVIDACECPTAVIGGEPCDTGIVDLLGVLSTWGLCPDPPELCPADVDGDGMVGIIDLLEVLTAWGPC